MTMPLESVKVDLVQPPKKDDIVVWHYDMEVLDIDECKGIHNYITNFFQGHNVLGLPLKCQIQYLDRKDLEGLVEFLTEYLVNND